jgi:hypothetical protein
MSRIRRGFKLAGVSWKVIVAEPMVLVVLAIGLVGSAVTAAGLFAMAFRRLPVADDFTFPRYLIVVPMIWLGSVFGTYCNVVVSIMANRRLEGYDPTVAEATEIANTKVGKILSWTLVAAAVGLVLQVIAERFKLGGVIASRLVGVAWGLATTFVIPILAMEDLTVRDTIKRSASVFKNKWGETVVAQGTVGLAVFIAVLPIAFASALVMAVSVPLGATLLALSFFGLIIVSGALDAVVDVALYRYAVDGEVLGAFTAADLEASFKPKKRQR